MKLLRKIFKIQIVEVVMTSLLVLGTGFNMLTPDFEFFRVFSNYTVHYMLLTLLAGIFFLVMDNKRLMFLSFLCCGVLCVFLKNRSDSQLRLASLSSQPSITVTQVNLSNIEEDYEGFISLITLDSIDLICFQEVTPDWAFLLKESLLSEFPHTNELVRIDPYGQLIFSKLPISKKDTLFYDKVPNLSSTLALSDGNLLKLISVHPPPIVSDESNDRYEEHLRLIGDQIKTDTMASIILGDFNIVPWANEIQTFKEYAILNDCRREFVPASPLNSFNFNKLPIEHIFYNNMLECVTFQELNSNDADYLGIKGKYQLIEINE